MANAEVNTTCGSLLRELQHIWDEVGEGDSDRDKVLLQLEEECLNVYRRKVKQAGHTRDLLYQAIADVEAEVASLCKTLGERYTAQKADRKAQMTLKEKLQEFHPQLEELRKKKDDRMRGFKAVEEQIQSILVEIAGSQLGETALFASTGEQDLSLARLDEFHTHLQALRKEKDERSQRVCAYVATVTELCALLGMDSGKVVTDIHPSLENPSSNHAKSISDDTLDGLTSTIQSLQLEKKQRLVKLQGLCTSLIELWDLMDTPSEEQTEFRCIVKVKENDISTDGILSLDNLKKMEDEVRRLDSLKAGRIRELVLKKLEQLNRICTEAHMEPHPESNEDTLMVMVDSGTLKTSELLERVDNYVADAIEEASSRKEILEKMEKWLSACEEEIWLEDYNQDENRYNISRGAHINLKRAERARMTIQKLPCMIEGLIAKTKAWEENKGSIFCYDGVCLLDLLTEHNAQRKEKEQERRRLRDQKKLQEQIIAEQEALFGSRASPHKPVVSAKKGLSVRGNGNNNMPGRRLSMAQTPAKNGATPGKNAGNNKQQQQDRTRPAAPVNYVALSNELSSTVLDHDHASSKFDYS